ncbi:hypothetical protein ACFVVA_36985 [Kitasatospora sp. NPDC058048]|uniref:hypothetical protein n=1 Tax=Kitasatospora sp. NPDC058048 TaxID=3346313 RepID=UPI0036DCA4D2
MPEHTDDHNDRAIPQFAATIPGQRRGSTRTGGGRPFGPRPGTAPIPRPRTASNGQ